MKKWFVFILALVVLAGSSYPCCQEENCQDELTSSSNKTHHEKGACSPFFACGTCSGFIQTARPVIIPLSTVESSDYYERLSVFFSSNYYSSFFQPPRSS